MHKIISLNSESPTAQKTRKKNGIYSATHCIFRGKAMHFLEGFHKRTGFTPPWHRHVSWDLALLWDQSGLRTLKAFNPSDCFTRVHLPRSPCSQGLNAKSSWHWGQMHITAPVPARTQVNMKLSISNTTNVDIHKAPLQVRKIPVVFRRTANLQTALFELGQTMVSGKKCCRSSDLSLDGNTPKRDCRSWNSASTNSWKKIMQVERGLKEGKEPAVIFCFHHQIRHLAQEIINNLRDNDLHIWNKEIIILSKDSGFLIVNLPH